MEEPLAGEGSAAVYRATDTRLDRAVALRALSAAEAGGGQQGKAAARLVHPNVARVLDFGTDAELGLEFVVADLGTGGSLAALLVQRGVPPLPLALRMVQEAAAGMAAAHRAGLVHGDLHPGVLWLSRDEGRLRVQVLGLGLNPAGGAAPARHGPLRLARAAAPRPRAGAAADVFSLGVIAYEVFAGLPAEWKQLLLAMARGQAVVAPSLLEARPDLPAHVAQAVRRALLADPAPRWPDAGEMAAHLIAERAAAPAPAGRVAVARAGRAVEAPVTAASFAAAVAGAAAPAEPRPVEGGCRRGVDAVAAPQPVEAEAAAAPVVAAAPVIEPVASAEAAARRGSGRRAGARTPRPAPLASRRPRVAAAADALASTDLADTLLHPAHAAEAGAARDPASAPASAEIARAAPPPGHRASAAAGARAAGRADDRSARAVAPEPAAEAGRWRIARRRCRCAPPSRWRRRPRRSVARRRRPRPSRCRSGAARGWRGWGSPPADRRAMLAAGIVRGAGGRRRCREDGAGGHRRETRRAEPCASQRGGHGRWSASRGGGSRRPWRSDARAVDTAARRRIAHAGGAARAGGGAAQAGGAAPAAAAPAGFPAAGAQLAAQRQAAARRRWRWRPRPAAAARRPRRSWSSARRPGRTRPPAAAGAGRAPAADANRVYGGGGGGQAPSLANGSAFRSAVNRSYPNVLRGSDSWGNAVVSFTVGAGRARGPLLHLRGPGVAPGLPLRRGGGHRAARFNPARVDGQPVRAQRVHADHVAGRRERDDD